MYRPWAITDLELAPIPSPLDSLAGRGSVTSLDFPYLLVRSPFQFALSLAVLEQHNYLA